MTGDSFSLTSISRAMVILDALEHSAKLSLADLSRATGLSEPTALRYVTSLTTHGLLERDPENGRYGLGMRLFLLGENALKGRDPRGTALPHMQSLRERFEETVNLAMKNGPDLILIEVLESPRSIRMGASLGERDEWGSSALGKAILAHLGESEARALLGHGPDSRSALGMLASVRTVGYSVDNGESQPDLRCVGAPIFDRDGLPRYALSVSGPESRIALESIPMIGADVREAAATISASLGHLPSLRERQMVGHVELIADR
jgi:DNA-binding IclR family transcriptional regulator